MLLDINKQKLSYLSFSYECSTQNIGLWSKSSGWELVFSSSSDTT